MMNTIDEYFELIFLYGMAPWLIVSLLLIRYQVVGREGGALLLILTPLWMYVVVGLSLVSLMVITGDLIHWFTWFIAKKEDTE